MKCGICGEAIICIRVAWFGKPQSFYRHKGKARQKASYDHKPVLANAERGQS